MLNLSPAASRRSIPDPPDAQRGGFKRFIPSFVLTALLISDRHGKAWTDQPRRWTLVQFPETATVTVRIFHELDQF